MTLKKIIHGKKLTDLDKEILEYIVQNIDVVLDQGVRTVARNTYTSPSTVIRLSQKLGYAGFVDMCYKLKPMLEEEDFEEDEIYYNYMQNIHKYNNASDLQKVVETFPQKNELIFIYATGFSGIVGEYLYKKLLVKGYKVIVADNSDSVAVFENNLDNIHLFIAISKSGETPGVLEKVKTAKNHNIPVLSFTSEISNELSRQSEMVIRIKDRYKSDDSNIYLNYFFSETIFAIENILGKI